VQLPSGATPCLFLLIVAAIRLSGSPFFSRWRLVWCRFFFFAFYVRAPSSRQDRDERFLESQANLPMISLSPGAQVFRTFLPSVFPPFSFSSQTPLTWGSPEVRQKVVLFSPLSLFPHRCSQSFSGVPLPFDGFLPDRTLYGQRIVSPKESPTISGSFPSENFKVLLIPTPSPP